MRSYQVFAGMPPERATALLKGLAEKAPAVCEQAVQAASAALKARPVYLRRQPLEKRAAAVRRALARVNANEIASEILAVYFLECRKELLIEWLDRVGLAHEEGTLKDDLPPQPTEAVLREAVQAFLGADADPDRELLLRAFAAQDVVEWPQLDALLEARS
jgi:hypothetical protein